MRAARYLKPEHNALLREADRARRRAEEIRAWCIGAAIVVALVFWVVHQLSDQAGVL